VFEVVAGIVDTDSYASLIHFPFFATGKDGVHALEKGTPIVQVIPFKRADTHLPAAIKIETEAEAAVRQRTFRNTLAGDGWYRKFARAPRWRRWTPRHDSSPLSIIVAALATFPAIISATFPAIVSATIVSATVIAAATVVAAIISTIITATFASAAPTTAASSAGPVAAATVPAAVPPIALPIPRPGRTFILVRAAKKPQDPVADAFLRRIIAGLRTLLCHDLAVRDERTCSDGKKAACRANRDAPQRYSAALHCGTNPARTDGALFGQFDII
jgi:hypothetical protein